MNKFFKSKSEKNSSIISKEVKSSKRETTEVMSSVIGMLIPNFRGVNKESNDNNYNNNSTGLEKKNQGSLKPPVLGLQKEQRKIHKERIENFNKTVQPSIENPIVNSSFKSTIDNNQEKFKRAQVEETLIRKQSKILITKGANDKIIVAQKIHTTERSIRFTKNYFNNTSVNENTSEDVEISSTTEDDPQKLSESNTALRNLSNDWDNVSLTSNKNLKSEKLKTYKNATKIIGLNSDSDSDSTIVMMPRALKKNKKINKNTNGLSKNKKRPIKDKPKPNSSVNKKPDTIRRVNPKNNMLPPSRLIENFQHKKMDCKIQNISANDSDTTISLTPNEYKYPQNIIRNKIDNSSLFDSDSTVLLTPVETNKSQITVEDKITNIHESGSDSVIFSTPIEELENRKKQINETFDKSYKSAKKQSKKFSFYENVSSQSVDETSQKFFFEELRKKLSKIFKEERLRSLGLSSQELNAKVAAIFKHGESVQTNTSPFSSQELKEKLDKILEDEASANFYKSPPIDKLRQELSEIFGDDVSSSQIDPLPTTSTQKLINILKPSQNNNVTVDNASLTDQFECLSSQVVDSFQTVHSSLGSSMSVQANLITSEAMIDSESDNIFATSNKQSLNKNSSIDSSTLNKKNSLLKIKNRTPEKNKTFTMNIRKSSKSQEGSNVKKLEVAEKNEKIGLEKTSVVNEELEDTLKIDESNESLILDDTLKLLEIPDSTNYKVAELMNLDREDYDEESDDLTDSSLGRLIIDESTDEDTEFLDNSNINEITEDLIDTEKDPLCVNNNNQDPRDVAVLESETQRNAQEDVNSSEENKKLDPSVRSEKTKVDDSDINFKKIDNKRKLFVSLERIDIDKFKQKNLTKKSNNSKPKTSSRKKISLSKSQVGSYKLSLKKELKVRLERLPLKINQNTFKIDNNMNIILSKDKALHKLNNSLKKSNKIVQHKTDQNIRETERSLREVRIILTPIQWKDYQDVRNKQTNVSGNNETMTSPTVDKRLSRNKNNKRVSSVISKSNRNNLDYTNLRKQINKKRSKSKLGSKVVKSTNNSFRNRKVQSNLKAIKTNFTLTSINQYQNLKELRVILQKLSLSDLVMWRKNK